MDQTNTPQANGFNWNDFFSFKNMIALRIIQVIYILGAVSITIGGLICMFTFGGLLGFFIGLLIIAVGNVFWRVWCELIIIFFRINKTLNNIEANTAK